MGVNASVGIGYADARRRLNLTRPARASLALTPHLPGSLPTLTFDANVAATPTIQVPVLTVNRSPR